MGLWNENVDIYHIIDPRNGLPFYVGQTSMIEKRIKCHKSLNTKASVVIKEIYKSGFEPIFEVIETMRFGWHMKRETEYILKYKSMGFPIINTFRRKEYNTLLKEDK